MFLTIFKELKNKKENKEKNIDLDKKTKKINDKKEKKKEKDNKKEEKKQKKEVKKESKNYRRIPFYKYTKKEKQKENSFLKILLSYYTFPVFFMVFLIYVIYIVFFTIQEPIYITGHFEKYTEEKSVFIPNLCRVKTYDFFREINVNEGDIIYYNYDKKHDVWEFNKDKGLELEILEINDYYTTLEILNIDSFVIDNITLDNFNIKLYMDCKVPLKKSWDNYKIYFSFNEGLNNIRNRFGF